jgi:uncharacterized repeat protein (TIGR01451 family)
LRSDAPAPIALALTLIVGLLLALLPSVPAFAAPVYEIEGRWAEATPAEISPGKVVTAEWRVNVNDDQEAPANTPVDNVTFTATAGNGKFSALPDVCLTTGVTPASSISDDRSTLVCNLGTQRMGTAIAVQTPIVSDGVSGDDLTLSGAIGGQTATLPPIPIVGVFGMDMTWDSPSSWNRVPVAGEVEIDYQWTLNLLKGSEAGPNSVSYTLTLDQTGGGGSQNDPRIVTGIRCEPFTLPGVSGHPWSGGDHPADQTAPFPGSCTLTPVPGSANTYTMTLTGIDYSLAQVPTKDSAGNSLPTDRSAIASGRVLFSVKANANTSVSLESTAPTYVSSADPTMTSVDDPSNNDTSKTWVIPGSFAAAYIRSFTGSGGTNWDDTYRVAPGTVVRAQNDVREYRYVNDPDVPVEQCSVIDTRYSTFTEVGIPVGSVFVPESAYTFSYYVGTDPLVTPGSGAFDPEEFVSDCDKDAGNWVTTLPTDLSTIKAVRGRFLAGDGVGRQAGIMQVYSQINEDAPVGSDVWTVNSYRIGEDAEWKKEAEALTATPGSLYDTTTASRDILRVVSVSPYIQKSVDRSSVKPGETVVYTLQYSANGGTAAPETVDDYVIRDTLPAGATYVPGSATPEPVVTTGGGRQILTWTLDGVPTNQTNGLTYQVVIGSGEPGATLRNTVTSSVGGLTSAPWEADVTITTNGSTTIDKRADAPYIPNTDGEGTGTGSWTVTIRSNDPISQAFTDTIDVLPYVGDGRGTSYSGSYALTGVTAVPGSTVYYTTAAPGSLNDDPADPTNGAAGTTAGNTVGWTTTRPANPTAVRVIGPALAPGATQAFTVAIQTDGVVGGDVLVNRAQGRAEHTELVMRTSAPITVANSYSALLLKEVWNGEDWVDANVSDDYPSFKVGDTVRYRITIKNTGQGTLTGLNIVDDRFPEAGNFTVDELAPQETASKEFSVVLPEGVPDTLVNLACASADMPVDAEVPPDIDCDPAGIKVTGDPNHTKSVLSAEAIGDGQWRVVYGISVTNSSTSATEYTLDDALRFTDDASIVSATVSSAPPGVTLAQPAWNGQSATRIASAVPLLGNDDTGYAPHEYELTVIATVPLQIPGAGGNPDPTACGPDGDKSTTAFNNTSTMTSPSNTTEEDQACAEPPSISIDKTVSEGPTPTGDGTWSVVYDIVVTNAGAGAGVYDLADRMTVDGDITVDSAEVATAPAGVTTNASWTGQGAVGAPENVISTGVALPGRGVHTYRVEAIISLPTEIDGAPVVTPCPPPGEQSSGGVTNSGTVAHNGLEDSDDACVTVGYVDVDKTVSAGPTGNGDGTWTVTYDIVATHAGGDAAATYNILDQLKYGEGIDVLDSDVVLTPPGVTASDTWTGLGAAGSAENVIATDVAMPVGGRHLYQVEVTFELADDIDPGELICRPGDVGGLANSATTVSNDIPAIADACGEVPKVEFSKEISAGPTPMGDGKWAIDYKLVVTNIGTGPGDYDLTDRLQYGEGIEIVSADVSSTPDGVEDPAGWTGQGAAGAAENVVATDVTLAEGQAHTYGVRVVVTIDPETATPPTVNCGPGGGGPGKGLFNSADMTHNGEPITDTACAPTPLISIDKSLSGAVTPVEGERGVYDAVYELTVTNSGAGAGQYNLDDELSPGEGVRVVGIQGVETDTPDSVGINPEFDGVDDVRIVTDQPIAGAAEVPVVHTYTVTVRYALDLSGVEVPTDAECADESGEPTPGSLGNEATADWNGIEDTDEVCVLPNKPTLDKALVSAKPIGGGQWEVVYDLTVGNTGDEATTYDLDDEFRFAPAIGVDSTSVTGPDGVEIDESFDGEENTRIASDVPLAGIDDEGYAPHVYRVTVIANVPLALPAPAEDGTGGPGCILPGKAEQGLNNSATLTDANGATVTDEACAPVTQFAIDKSIAGKPTKASNGDWTILYDIVVTNTGDAAGKYTLSDRLRFGAGIEVESAEVTGAPEGVTVADSWTGQGAVGNADNVISSDVDLAAGGVHAYRVRVVASIQAGATDGTTAVCPTGADGNGGFANTAAIAHNGLTAADDACATPPPPPLAITGADVMWLAGLALAILLLGMIAMVLARRRSEA